ncbi:hypothetical protein Tco_0369638 [Tanacetum coccineum]
MRNKADLDELSMDDLYNNLKVYEAEIKSKSSSSSNYQNVAFVSSDDTSSTNEAVNIAHDVHAARSKGQASSSTYADDVMFSYFVKQSNSLQLENEDLEQIDTDDLEEMDLKWQVRDNSITELKNQLAEALREKDDLKLELEKFETSSMKLTKLINSQISVNNKSGVGFDSQMNENELYDCHLNKSEVFKSASNSSVNEIEKENNQVNDRFKKVEGYHVVPPPYTRNYMPSRPDLSFAGLDDYVYKTNVSETISSVPRIESTASKSSKDSLEQPKDVRPSAPIIEEWESDSDDDCVIRPSFEQNKPSYAKINFVKSDENTRKSVIEQHTYRQAENLRKSQSPRVDKRNWNGIMTQKLGDGFEFNKKACFVCGSLNHLIKDCNFYENKMVGKSMLNNMGRVTGQREIRPQKELTDEEKAKLFMEFMEKRRKYFAALRAQEKRKRPPTKTQKRNQMSIYLKHMEISGKKDESSSKRAKITQDSIAKRARDKLESDKSKKQKTDENEEVEVDNEAELKKHMVTVKDDDIAIDAIPLATKPLVIIEYKLIREGIMEHYQLIRADGSFKRYSFMIRMLQGLQVKQKEDMIFISQDKYVTEILKKFGFSDVKTASTPMETHKPLLKDVKGEDVDEHMYRSMIGSLMYLTSLRPDIMFAVCVCVRFQVNPKVSHLHVVKRIFRHLKGQPKLGLWYPTDSPFDLVAYSDNDYAGASLDRKYTTGGCQFLGCRLISWQCKKQTVVANSTTEVEYVAASSCCGQVLWIQNQLLDYGYNFMHTKIYIDNESTICIVKNPVFHSKTKHIEIRHHFIRDSNEKKLI